MFDFTCIVLLSLGLTTAKTDLNSHQPYSKPFFFSEGSVRLQKENLNYFGFRMSYYKSEVEVREIFQDEFGSSHSYNYLVSSLYIGKGLRFRNEDYISLDAGLAYIAENDKFGLPARLRYTREIYTRKRKQFNLSASLGMDYWIGDNLDDYEDVTTLDGDYMFHFTVGIEFPFNARPD